MAALAGSAFAQDRITLANGDVLTGTIKTMDGKDVMFTSPGLGDVKIPMTNIKDMVTGPVSLRTKSGDTLVNRRIVGIEGGNLRLEGETSALMLENLGMINPPPKLEPAWAGSVKVNALWTNGNTDRRAIGAAFDASRRSEIDRITVDASWDYADDKSNSDDPAVRGRRNLSQRRTGAGIKYDYFLDKRWYALATARVLGDTLADINLRFTGGAGLGYTVIEDKATTLLVEAGLSYFNENYRSDTPSVDYVSARLAYRLTHAFSDKTKLLHSVEAFPSLENAKDTYLQAKTEITTSLTESMIASVAHVLDWDNTPAPGRERTDNRVMLSVGWSF